MKEKIKFHNSHYDLYHLKDLYERAKEAWERHNQWANREFAYSPERVLHYFIKCETLVELMESVTVFHIGLGYGLDDGSLKERLDSFKWIESIDFSTL